VKPGGVGWGISGTKGGYSTGAAEGEADILKESCSWSAMRSGAETLFGILLGSKGVGEGVGRRYTGGGFVEVGVPRPGGCMRGGISKEGDDSINP
jgi:hypothetical protein